MIRRANADDVEEIVAIFEPSFALFDFVPKLHTHEENLAWFANALREGEGYPPTLKLGLSLQRAYARFDQRSPPRGGLRT